MKNIVKKRRNSPLFDNIFNISLTSGVQLHIHLLNVVIWLSFSSILQIWYVEVRISQSISEIPLEFEITRVDCNSYFPTYVTYPCIVKPLKNRRAFSSLLDQLLHICVIGYDGQKKQFIVSMTFTQHRYTLEALDFTTSFWIAYQKKYFCSCSYSLKGAYKYDIFLTTSNLQDKLWISW